MKPLHGLSLLLVEDDPDAGEMLAMALGSKGATCRVATTGAAAMVDLTASAPDLILCDVSLPDGSGLEWLPRFRGLPGLARVPAIAISTGSRAVDRAESLAAGFEKHIVKPASLLDIMAAISIVTAQTNPFDLKTTLARVAAASGCRYTSLLRFEEKTLVSVWTFDRDNPATDAFPLQMPITSSYCMLVRDTDGIISIENALEDPRAAGHPAQHTLASYLGSPVVSADGGFFGTLCTYDESPRAHTDGARTALADAAKELALVIKLAA